jgi:hypothetical protein
MKTAGRSGRLLRGTRSDRPSTVLFVDDYPWDCFFQLAAGVRRAGFRAVRVTTTRPSRAASLCFHRSVHISSSPDLVQLSSILAGEDIADVQVVESLAVETYNGLAVMPRSRWSHDWTRRAAAVDKLFVSNLLHARGLRSPQVIAAPVAGAAQVVDALGLPVVCKVRIGSGGLGVWIIPTLDALERLLAEGCNSDSYFFEQHIGGRPLQYGAVINSGHVELDVTYETVSRTGHMGPASEVFCFEDRDLANTGSQVAESLGISGMINVEVIRDAEGRDWVHDVNPRVWGSFASFRPAKLDLLGTYVRWLRGTDSPIPQRHVEARLEVFPSGFESSLRSESRMRTHLRFLRSALPYLKWIGPRYVAYETLRYIRKMQS